LKRAHGGTSQELPLTEACDKREKIRGKAQWLPRATTRLEFDFELA